MHSSPSFSGLKQQWPGYAATFLVLVAAIYARLPFANFASGDIVSYVFHWYDTFIKFGLVEGIRQPFFNYTPSYPYLLGIMHSLFPGLKPLYAIKIVSFMGEGLAAALAYRMTQQAFPQSKLRPMITGAAVLFSPLVIINSVMSGQCDIFHTLCILGSLYMMLAGRPRLALIWFGLGVSFKPWGMFVAPFLAIFLFTGKIRWRDIWIPPAVYYATFIPAWLAGRDFWDMATLYFRFSGTFVYVHNYSLYTAGLCGLLEDVLHVPVTWEKLIVNTMATLTFAFTAGYIYLGVRSVRRQPISPQGALLLVAFIASFIPYIAPYMHERYGYTGNLFAVLLACWMPRYLPAAIMMNMASWMSFRSNVMPWQYTVQSIPYEETLAYAITLNTIGIAMLAYGCWHHVWKYGFERWRN